MFVIIRRYQHTQDIFGPFPTEERAEEYAKSFEKEIGLCYQIFPIIVPNCVTVTLNY